MISALTTEIGKSGIFLCHNIPFSQACFGKIPVQGKKVIKEYTFKVRNYEHSLNVFFRFTHARVENPVSGGTDMGDSEYQ